MNREVYILCQGTSSQSLEGIGEYQEIAKQKKILQSILAPDQCKAKNGLENTLTAVHPINCPSMTTKKTCSAFVAKNCVHRGRKKINPNPKPYWPFQNMDNNNVFSNHATIIPLSLILLQFQIAAFTYHLVNPSKSRIPKYFYRNQEV